MKILMMLIGRGTFAPFRKAEKLLCPLLTILITYALFLVQIPISVTIRVSQPEILTMTSFKLICRFNGVHISIKTSQR